MRDNKITITATTTIATITTITTAITTTTEKTPTISTTSSTMTIHAHDQSAQMSSTSTYSNKNKLIIDDYL